MACKSTSPAERGSAPKLSALGSTTFGGRRVYYLDDEVYPLDRPPGTDLVIRRSPAHVIDASKGSC
jgi:hypothetical protein